MVSTAKSKASLPRKRAPSHASHKPKAPPVKTASLQVKVFSGTFKGLYEAVAIARQAHGSAKSFVGFYKAEPLARVEAIKQGVPTRFVDDMAQEMGRTKDWLLPTVGVSTATFNRRKSESKPLAKDDSERVMGIARLVGQVQNMVAESGDATGFNAAQWVGQWLDAPLPALNGMRPRELMDTAEGQAIVASILARAQSGAYA